MFLTRVMRVIRVAVTLFVVADLCELTLFYPREAYRFVTVRRTHRKMRLCVAPHAGLKRHSVSFNGLTPAGHRPGRRQFYAVVVMRDQASSRPIFAVPTIVAAITFLRRN